MNIKNHTIEDPSYIVRLEGLDCRQFSFTICRNRLGGLFLGYLLKKAVKLIAVVIGLFIAGLAYLQYQQIAYFDWDKIERMVTTTFRNVTTLISSNHGISSFALSNFGIPLTSGMSAGLTIGFMKG